MLYGWSQDGREGDRLANRAQNNVETHVLVITGPVGVGKTSTAIAIGEELNRAGTPHAVIDADWLRWATPIPPDDPFNSRLGFRNLAAVATNFRAAGARWLLVADIVEGEAEREAYRDAIPDAHLTIIRLRAPVDEIHHRLDGRETGHGLVWHKDRAIELSALMDERAVEDLLIETAGRSVEAVAHDILARVRQSPSSSC